jgi:hypothetical protein
MSAKMSAARRAAFLKALSETGNITVSAERAKVSRSWVRLHRSGDAGFDSACRASLDSARSKLLDHARDERSGEKRGSNRPPSGWGFAGGEELVVKGTRSGTGRRVQVARARIKQWTSRVERRFLAMLLATANVTASCRAVGMTPASAFGHRSRWPRFAALWDAAVTEGSLRIEMETVMGGVNFFSDTDLPDDVPVVAMTAAEAIHILHMTKHKTRGIGKAPGKRPAESGGVAVEREAEEEAEAEDSAVRAADSALLRTGLEIALRRRTGPRRA